MNRPCTVVTPVARPIPHPDFATDSFVEVTKGNLTGRQGVVRGMDSRGSVLVEFAGLGKVGVLKSRLKTITKADTRAALNRGAVQRAIKGGHFNA